MEIVTAKCASIISAASHTGNYRLFKGKAQIWDTSTGKTLSEFPTVFDGMRRHALSSDGEFYAAANWRKGKDGGVACYNTRTGDRIWHRADLGQVQGIRFSPKGDKVWCCVEQRPVHCLDSGTGILLAKLRGVSDVVESAYSSDLVLQSRNRAFFLIANSKAKEVRKEPGSMMSDAVFSPDALCLAEYVGPVRCLDCKTGEERWRYTPPRGSHVIRLSYQDDGAFYGHLFEFESDGAALLRFSSTDGACIQVCRYELSATPGGDFGVGLFVAGNGEMISLLDGRIVDQLSFAPISDE